MRCVTVYIVWFYQNPGACIMCDDDVGCGCVQAGIRHIHDSTDSLQTAHPSNTAGKHGSG